VSKDVLRIAVVLVAASIFLTSAVVWSFSPKEPSKPSDYHIGMPYEKAVKSSKPFLLLFYTNWCSTCMRFMPEFNRLKEEYKNELNFVTVNGDDAKYRNLMFDYRIGAFPSLYIVDPAVDYRVFINSTFYGGGEILKGEINKYLRVRKNFVECKN